MKPVIPQTVTYVIRKNQILLGKKLVRTGKGYWNGFGGNIERGETVEEAAMRELREETTSPLGQGIVPLNYYRCGLVLVKHLRKDRPVLLTYFIVTDSSGQAHQTDEMIPK